MIRALWYVAPLLLLLSACAPTIRGASMDSPLAVAEGEQVEVERGREVHLRFEHALEVFGLQRKDVTGAFWIPAGANSESANLMTRFALQRVRVPAGWELELAQIRALRVFETAYGRDTGTVEYSIRPVYRLKVPVDAALGETTVRAELMARSGTAKSVEIPLRVRAPANR
jgi:hypothetical protein